MAVDVTPGPELIFSSPHELFPEPSLAPHKGYQFDYQPSKDGNQFLMLLPVGDAPLSQPLTVVTNWASVHKK